MGLLMFFARNVLNHRSFSDLIAKRVRVSASLFALLCASSALAQQIVDPSAPIQFRPRVGVSANGTPLVDIARPSFGGVSHNKFQRYDVDQRGVILNNSGLGGTSVIGGAVGANPNLAGAPPARVIVNEVTSNARSTLNGPTEIFGQKADVVVANPNGVVCSGCGFINAGRVTLTTGVPIPDYDTGAVAFSVTRGAVEISGAGVSGAAGQSVRAIDLVGRQLSIQGPVAAADEVRLRAGSGTYDQAANRWTPTSPTLAVTGPAIQSSGAGAISAGAISALSSDVDLGVVLDGPLAALSGPLTIKSAGQARLASTNAAGDISVSAQGVVTLTGVHKALGRITLDGAHVVVETGADVAANDSILISALQSLVTRGTLRAGQSIALVSQGTLVATGVIAAQGQVILQARDLAAADLTIAAGSDARLVGVDHAALDNSQIGAGGDVRLSAANVELGAGTLFQSPGVIALDARDALVNDTTLTYPNLQLSVLGSYAAGAGSALVEDALLLTLREGIDNAGLLAGRVSVDLTAQSLINRDSGVVAGATMSIALSSDLTNLGRVLSDTTLAVVARDIRNDGQIAANGDLTLQARSYLAESPAAQLSARNAQIVVAGLVDNQGQILAGDALALRAGALANRATGSIGAATITLMTAGDLVNQGQIVARDGLLAAIGGGVMNSAVISSNGATRLAATGSLLNSGEISGRAVSLEADGLVNSGEKARIFGETVALRLSGDLSNAGLIQSGGDLSIQAGALKNAALAPTSDGAFVGLIRGSRVALDLSGDLINAGSIISASDLALSAANLTNSGEISGSGALMAQLSGDVSNQGRILAGGALGLDARSYLGSTQARIQGQDVIVSLGGVFDNAGLILALRDANISAGSICNRGGVSEVSAAGALSLRSRGDLLNDGLIAAATALRLDAQGGLTNSGAIQVSEGPLALSAGGAIANLGAIIGSNDLTLAATSLANAAGAQISALTTAVRLSGALTNDGAILGQTSLSIAAGSATNGAYSASTSNGLIAARHLDLAISGALSNAGLISGQDVATVHAGSLSDTGEISGASVAVTVSGDASVVGQILSAADLKVSAGALNVAAGAIVRGDDVMIVANGVLANAGLVDAISALDLKAGAASNLGAIQSAGGASLLIAGDMTNSGVVIAAQDMVVKTGGSLSTTGAISAGGGLTVVAGGGIASGGLMRASGVIAFEGAFYTSSSNTSVVSGRTVSMRLSGALANLGLVVAKDDMTLSAGSFDNGPLGTLANGQTYGLIAASKIDAAISGAAVNRGVVNTTAGALSFTAAALDNSGQINAAGDFGLVVAGLVANSGQIATGGALDARLGSYAGASGSHLLAAAASLNLSGDFANAGAVSVSNLLALSSAGSFGNSGAIEAGAIAATAETATNSGAIRAAGAAAFSFASLANTGAISAGQSLSFVLAGDLVNAGQLQAGQALAIASGSLSNTQAGSLDAKAIVIQTGALTNAGAVVASDTLQIAASSLSNAAPSGVATISADALSLSIAGALANGPNALIQAQTGSSVSAASYSSGFLSKRTSAEGLFSFGRNLDMSVTQGGWTFASDLIVLGDLSFSAQGDIVNSATVAAGGALNLTSTGGSILNGGAGAGGGASSSGGFAVLTRADVANILGGGAVGVDPAFPTTYFQAAGHVLAVSTGEFQTTQTASNESITAPVSGSATISSGPSGTIVTAGAHFNVSDLSAGCATVTACPLTSVIELRIDPFYSASLPSGLVAAYVPNVGTSQIDLLNPRLGGRIQSDGYVLLRQLADGSYDFAPTAGQPTTSSTTPASQIYSGGAMTLSAGLDIVNASAFVQAGGDLALRAGRDLSNSRVSGGAWGLSQVAEVSMVPGSGSDASLTYQSVGVMAAGTQAQGVGAIAAQGSIQIVAGSAVRNEAGLLTSGGDLTVTTARYLNTAASNPAYSSTGTWTYQPDSGSNAYTNYRAPWYLPIDTTPGAETASSVYAARTLTITASQSYLNTGSEVANGVVVRAPSITVGVTDPNVFTQPTRLPAASVNLGYFLSPSAPSVVGPAAINGVNGPLAWLASGPGGRSGAQATTASTVEASLTAPLPPPNPRQVNLPGAPDQPAVSVTYLYNAPIAGSNSRDPSWILRQVGDARTNLSVFADPQTEQRLIQQALVSSIGKSMLDPSYKDPAGQQAALYQGAVDFLKANPDIHLGQRLTDAQRAGVSKPMLWYNEQDVGGVKTLVPELVLPPSMLAAYAAPTGGSIDATSISLVGDQVTNAGTIVAKDSLVVTAGAFLNQARLTQPSDWTRAAVAGYFPARPDAPAIATMGGTIGADTLSIVSDRDFVNRGGSITAGSSAQIASLGGDVVNDALSNLSRSDLARGLLTRAPVVVGGSIMSGGSLDVVAQGRLVNTASSIDAFGDVSIYAREGITQQALTTSYLSDYSDSGGAFTSKTREVYSPIVFGASIASLGGDVSLVTKGDIVFNGGMAQAAGSLTASATNIALNSVIAEGLYKETKSGFHGLSYSSVTTKGNLIEVAQAGMIAGDALTLNAVQDVRGVGALVAAGGDATISAGNDIVFDALVKNYWQTTKGWSVGLSTPLTSLAATIAKAGDGPGGAANAVWSSLKMLAGMKNAGVANSVSGSPLTAGLWQNLTSATLSFNSFKSSKQWTQSDVSQITAGGDLTLSAGDDVALIGGAQAISGRDATLIAGNDVRLEAALDTMRSKSSNWGVSIGYGSGGVTVGANAGGSNASTDSYTNASLQSGRDTTIVAGRDVSVLGGKIAAGGDLYLDAGRDLTLKTLQDQSSSNSWSLNASVTIGPSPAASIGGSLGKGSSLWANDVTTVTANGVLDARVGGTTTLTGAGLWSTSDQLKLDTARLVATDLQERSNSWSVNGGLSFGLGNAFSLAGVSGNVGGSYASREGVTRATLGEGSVVVRSGADLASLNRDPARMQEVTADEGFSFQIPEINPLVIQQTVKDAANYLNAATANVPESVMDKGGAATADFQRRILSGATPENAEQAVITPLSDAMEGRGPNAERFWRDYIAIGLSPSEADEKLDQPGVREQVRRANNLDRLAEQFGGDDKIPPQARLMVFTGLDVNVPPGEGDWTVRAQIVAGCSVDAGPCDSAAVHANIEMINRNVGNISAAAFKQLTTTDDLNQAFGAGDPAKVDEVRSALQAIKDCTSIIEGSRAQALQEVKSSLSAQSLASVEGGPEPEVLTEAQIRQRANELLETSDRYKDYRAALAEGGFTEISANASNLALIDATVSRLTPRATIRALGGLRLIGGVLGMSAGVSACSTFAGCVAGLVAAGLSYDQANAGAKEILSGLATDSLLKETVEASCLSFGGSASACGVAATGLEIAANVGSTVATTRIAVATRTSTLEGAERLASLEQEAAAARGSGACLEGACAAGAGLCFVAGTPVLTPTGLKAIETLEAGDEVITRDERTGRNEVSRIARTFRNHDRAVRTISLHGPQGAEKIVATPEHPFFVLGKGWTKAKELRPKDRIATARQKDASGFLLVKAVTLEAERRDTYNFEVERTHTYFVGKNEAWVHNACAIGTSGGGPGLWVVRRDVQGAAADFQAEVTGGPIGVAYRVEAPATKSGEIFFDGVDVATRELIDAKRWFSWPIDKGFSIETVMEQAQRQSNAASRLGYGVVWYFPQGGKAEMVQGILDGAGITNIRIVVK